VYGLNGIIKHSPALPDASRPPSSDASFDELLRLQQELDKSIAALRLFSADDGPAEDMTPSNRSTTGQSIHSAKVFHKHESGSGRSEFSLSSFPEPPEVSTSPPSPSSLGPLRARQKQSRNMRKDDGTTIPIINIPKIDDDITMGSSDVLVGTSRVQRLDSAGTQYDVTSFIGDLTIPESSGLTGLTSAFRSAIIQPGDVESVNNSPVDITEVYGYNRPIITDSASLDSGLSLDPATASSGLLTSRLTHLSIGPGALTQNTLSAPTFEAPSTYHNPSVRRPVMGVRLPSRPRAVISPPLADVSEDAQDAFERPRPPPLLFEQLDTAANHEFE